MSSPQLSMSPAGTPPGSLVAPTGGATKWLGLLLLLAVGLTLAGWQLDRSYWNDEAWGVDFAMQPTLSKVWQTAMDKQLPGAPGYLALLHGADQARGLGPWVYRVPSIAAGLLMVFMAVALARPWCSSWPLACSAGLLLLANPFVQRYLTEAKQYMGDAAFVLAILVATRWRIVSARPAAAVAWTLCAVVGVTMSFAFWFSLAATGPLLLIVWGRRGDRKQIIRVVVAGLLTAASAAVVYLAYARQAASGQGGMGFWQPFFLTKDLHLFGQLWAFWSEFLSGSWSPYVLPGGVMLAASCVGLVVWIWREPITGIAALSTLVITILANLAGLWPMVIRVNLAVIVILNLAWMAVPLGLAGWCIDRLRSRNTQMVELRQRWDRGIACGSLIAVIGLAAATLWMSRSFEHEPSNIHALMREIAQRAGDGDQVVLDWASRVNQAVEPVALRGKVTSFDWPDMSTVAKDYGALIRSHQGRTFVLSSMDNHDRAAVWEILGKSLEDIGTLERVWLDKSRRAPVAIYEFRWR